MEGKAPVNKGVRKPIKEFHNTTVLLSCVYTWLARNWLRYTCDYMHVCSSLPDINRSEEHACHIHSHIALSCHNSLLTRQVRIQLHVQTCSYTMYRVKGYEHSSYISVFRESIVPSHKGSPSFRLSFDSLHFCIYESLFSLYLSKVVRGESLGTRLLLVSYDHCFPSILTHYSVCVVTVPIHCHTCLPVTISLYSSSLFIQHSGITWCHWKEQHTSEGITLFREQLCVCIY